MSHIELFANNVKYLDKKHIYKNSTKELSYIVNLSDFCNAIKIKGLKETTHGYKKNETKRMISRSNCNTMFLFFLTADSQILRNVHS